MKIAVLSSHTPSLFWFRMDMMQHFISLGHEVVAIADEPAEHWKDKFTAKGIKYIQADINRTGTNPINDFKTLISLRKILKAEAPDKIFTYQAKTVIYGTMAANMLGIYDVYPLIAGIGSVFLSEKFKSKIIAAILKTEYRFALRKCEQVFFQNPDDVQMFDKLGIVKRNKAVMLNGSGVNLDTFNVQPMPENFAFLCISRLIKDKGVLEYLEASRIVKETYPDVRFLLVGPFDSNPSAIKADALKPYIESGVIEYFGEQSDVRPYLAQCNVFVLASYREGTPKTVLEAMASCRAIITTDAPGCRQTVINGVNGFLIPVADISALVDKMEYMIENRESVKAMAEKGRAIVEERFDVKMVNRTIAKAMKIEGELLWNSIKKSSMAMK